MKLTSIERFLLETLENKSMRYEEIKFESGLKENICFNALQALVIKSIVMTDGTNYFINKKLNESTIKEINSKFNKSEETVELIELYLTQINNKLSMNKYALNEKDQKIYFAMLANLESFLKECHQKNKNEIPYKDRTFTFWGAGLNSDLINGAMA